MSSHGFLDHLGLTTVYYRDDNFQTDKVCFFCGYLRNEKEEQCLEKSAAALMKVRFTTTAMRKSSQRKRKASAERNMTPAFIALPPPPTYRSNVTNVHPTYVPLVTGVTNFRPIMKLEFAIDAMHFTVGGVMKWTNVMIAGKSFARRVQRSCRVNFAVVGCAKTALQRVDGT